MNCFDWKLDIKNKVYFCRHKLSNNQFCQMWIFYEEIKNHTNYYVAFAVASKKRDLIRWIEESKNNISLKSTGKCGAEALIWGRNAIVDFEKFVKEEPHKGYAKIYISGEDKKRQQMYERYFVRLGYKREIYYGSYYMVKVIQ